MAGRILIVTNGPLCRNPRPLKEAAALGRAGYDVDVLYVRNHAESEPQDAALMESAPFKRETVDLIPGPSTSRWTAFGRRLRQRAARELPDAAGALRIEGLGPARALLARARRRPADLTIVHNEVPHWVGLRLMGDGRRVAADIEDWHSEDLLPEDRRQRPLPLIRKVERALLSRAAYTSTTSEALADGLFARYGGTRPYVIANAFPLQPDPGLGRGTPPAFFWFSQTIGAGRGLEPFLAAWERTALPSRVVLLGAAAPGVRERLCGRLSAERRRAVSFLPMVPPPELPAVIARHDIGLALEERFILNRDLTITNKILQYLNAGLAVVASDTAGQREVVARDPQAGVIVELSDTAAVAQTLDAMLADPGVLAARQAAARRLAETTYCWEKEAPKLLEIVERALRRRPA